MRLVWAALATGCYGPAVSTGAACDPGPCPIGQICVAGTCMLTVPIDAPVAIGSDATDSGDAPPDVSAIDDMDGDGIVDSLDNCPTTYNPLQENEDGDRFGDVCDPCPPVMDDNPPDGDSDGVADACDPNPGIGGDSIALFEGFHHGVPTTGWTMSGTWMAGLADDVVVDDNGLGSGSMLVHGSFGPHETVSAAITLKKLNSGLIRYLGLVDDYGGSMQGIECQVVVTYSGHLTLYDLAAGTALANDALSESVGTTGTLAESKRDDMYQCRATTITQNKLIIGSSGQHSAAPQVGLRLQLVGASVAWVMVVKSP